MFRVCDSSIEKGDIRMVTKEMANITLKDLDRMKALAKYCAGVVVEGRVDGHSIAFTYSPMETVRFGAGWYVVEIQDGNETRRIEPDKDLDGWGMGPCAEGCGRPGRVKWLSSETRVVCMECYMAINAKTRREKHGDDTGR
jgi:hypothetical protein